VREAAHQGVEEAGPRLRGRSLVDQSQQFQVVVHRASRESFLCTMRIIDMTIQNLFVATPAFGRAAMIRRV
jgi:hypothetical protein